MKNERDERKDLERRVDEMPRTFATKDDIVDIKRVVQRVEDKLDRVIERRLGART